MAKSQYIYVYFFLFISYLLSVWGHNQQLDPFNILCVDGDVLRTMLQFPDIQNC